VAAFQENREATLQRLKAWKHWSQTGAAISYSHDSSFAEDEPLCAESLQQSLCSTTHSIVFMPTVPASVTRAALQTAFGSLAGLNEVIPGPVRADLVRRFPTSCIVKRRIFQPPQSGFHSACLGSF
jgi:hypothetical protein